MSISYVCDSCGKAVPVGGKAPGIHLTYSTFQHPLKDSEEAVRFFKPATKDFCSKECAIASLEKSLTYVKASA